ncbi:MULTISPECIES: GntR family transcriptional regulator [Mycolicibacterium]|uniref:GntR family transcriptional regulator n=1 Tax=Mycolicibacterium arseniciresistens TaxID=3062257 RepID=A0ABT8UDA4_9MYCO|nr:MULTISPECIES: GntR family transcriptional regulator [Mycolicibacterium]MDO3635052.1 GntR family transcriptional regulator [Mycolicibacterium arseniciresistens]
MLGFSYSFLARPEIGVDVPLSIELDRSSPVPLYYQLAQAIEAAIRDGELAPGDRFENELALASRLTLSRPTTRRAIQELVDKGLLVRKRGVGTQVVQNPVHRRVELTSLFDDLVRAGQEPTTELLEYHAGIVDEQIAAELNLAKDHEVVTIQRLRCANGEPLAVMTNYLPVELAPEADQLEANGLYQSLRARGVHIRLARQRIGAKPATRTEARLLDEKAGAPLLTMSRTAFDDSGKAVEFGDHCYRASRYYFETTLVDR